MNILIQGIGLIGYVMNLTSYWQSTKKRILSMQIISYLIYASHYYLLGGMTGCLSNIAGIITLILMYFKDKKENYNPKWMLGIIGLMYLVVALVTYENILSILPIFASIIPAIALWQSDKKYIRICGIIGSTCWLAYAFVVGSYVSMITNTIFNISTGLAIYKDYKKTQVQQKQ